jgi:serine/threonine protein kinase
VAQGLAQRLQRCLLLAVIILAELLAGWVRPGETVINPRTKETFVVERRIGEGGFAKLFSARRVSGPGKLGELVALKVFTASMSFDGAGGEARTLQTIRSYRAVQEEFDTNSSPYILHSDEPFAATKESTLGAETVIVQPLQLAVADLTKTALLELSWPSGRLSLDQLDAGFTEMERFIRDASRARADLARAGMIHGDLKPKNFLAIDMGNGAIRYVIGDIDTLHPAGVPETFGTPGFACPELLESAVGPRTSMVDAYSVSATLFALLWDSAPLTYYVERSNGLSDLRALHGENLEREILRSPELYADFLKFVERMLDTYAKNEMHAATRARFEQVRAIIVAGLQYRPEDRLEALAKVQGIDHDLIELDRHQLAAPVDACRVARFVMAGS